jgi:hypothetical protein
VKKIEKIILLPPQKHTNQPTYELDMFYALHATSLSFYRFFLFYIHGKETEIKLTKYKNDDATL